MTATSTTSLVSSACVSPSMASRLISCYGSDGGVPVLLCASDHSVSITCMRPIRVTLERANDGNGSRRRAAHDSTSASLPMRPGEPPRRTARGAVGTWDTTAPTQRSHLCQRRPARTLEFGGYPHRPPATHSIRILNSSLSPISNGSNSGPAAPRWRWDLLLFKKPYYCTHCWSLENKDTYPKGGTCEPKRGKILRVKEGEYLFMNTWKELIFSVWVSISYI